jgi:hypothetical protein
MEFYKVKPGRLIPYLDSLPFSSTYRYKGRTLSRQEVIGIEMELQRVEGGLEVTLPNGVKIRVYVKN